MSQSTTYQLYGQNQNGPQQNAVYYGTQPSPPRRVITRNDRVFTCDSNVNNVGGGGGGTGNVGIAFGGVGGAGIMGGVGDDATVSQLNDAFSGTSLRILNTNIVRNNLSDVSAAIRNVYTTIVERIDAKEREIESSVANGTIAKDFELFNRLVVTVPKIKQARKSLSAWHSNTQDDLRDVSDTIRKYDAIAGRLKSALMMNVTSGAGGLMGNPLASARQQLSKSRAMQRAISQIVVSDGRIRSQMQDIQLNLNEISSGVLRSSAKDASVDVMAIMALVNDLYKNDEPLSRVLLELAQIINSTPVQYTLDTQTMRLIEADQILPPKIEPRSASTAPPQQQQQQQPQPPPSAFGFQQQQQQPMYIDPAIFNNRPVSPIVLINQSPHVPLVVIPEVDASQDAVMNISHNEDGAWANHEQSVGEHTASFHNVPEADASYNTEANQSFIDRVLLNNGLESLNVIYDMADFAGPLPETIGTINELQVYNQLLTLQANTMLTQETRKYLDNLENLINRHLSQSSVYESLVTKINEIRRKNEPERLLMRLRQAATNPDNIYHTRSRVLRIQSNLSKSGDTNVVAENMPKLDEIARQVDATLMTAINTTHDRHTMAQAVFSEYNLTYEPMFNLSLDSLTDLDSVHRKFLNTENEFQSEQYANYRAELESRLNQVSNANPPLVGTARDQAINNVVQQMAQVRANIGVNLRKLRESHRDNIGTVLRKLMERNGSAANNELGNQFARPSAASSPYLMHQDDQMLGGGATAAAADPSLILNTVLQNQPVNPITPLPATPVNFRMTPQTTTPYMTPRTPSPAIQQQPSTSTGAIPRRRSQAFGPAKTTRPNSQTVRAGYYDRNSSRYADNISNDDDVSSSRRNLFDQRDVTSTMSASSYTTDGSSGSSRTGTPYSVMSRPPTASEAVALSNLVPIAEVTEDGVQYQDSALTIPLPDEMSANELALRQQNLAIQRNQVQNQMQALNANTLNLEKQHSDQMTALSLAAYELQSRAEAQQMVLQQSTADNVEQQQTLAQELQSIGQQLQTNTLMKEQLAQRGTQQLENIEQQRARLIDQLQQVDMEMAELSQNIL